MMLGGRKNFMDWHKSRGKDITRWDSKDMPIQDKHMFLDVAKGRPLTSQVLKLGSTVCY